MFGPFSWTFFCMVIAIWKPSKNESSIQKVNYLWYSIFRSSANEHRWYWGMQNAKKPICKVWIVYLSISFQFRAFEVLKTEYYYFCLLGQTRRRYIPEHHKFSMLLLHFSYCKSVLRNYHVPKFVRACVP